jgi:hypothetical protein
MKWLARTVVLIVGLYAIYYFAFPTYTHRFRLTFQVEVDGQVKEGTGVITVTDQDNQWVPLSQKRWKRATRGPSPWIDLGNRGILVVAINNHVPTDYEPRPYAAGMLSFVAFFKAKHGSPNISGRTVRDIRTQTGRRQLGLDQLPEFIWLPAPLDPLSAVRVPPQRFSELIGEGVVLRDVYVEVTNDEPNNSLYGKLPWLAEMERSDHGWAGLGTVTHYARFKLEASNLVGDP